VFFVHSKVLLIDPLSDDPLVCTGSANFSKNSLTANDENMLLIRGDTRVADIYMTELDRIFRHFRARDVINREATAGKKEDWLLLDTTDTWIGSNFTRETFKNNRRLLFFPQGNAAKPWNVLAAADPDSFADENQRAAKVRSDRSAKARDRQAARGGAVPRKKAPAKKVRSAKAAKGKPPVKKKAAAKKKAVAAKRMSKPRVAANKRTGKKTPAKKRPPR
jgi:hypothetical protein